MLVFGPVPSRRLGRSLGINNIPPKACSYSCVYCQVGPTRGREIERREFYAPAVIVAEVERHLSRIRGRGGQVDTLTLVPDGEPTLDIHLHETIDALRTLDIPIAIISNASLIWQEAVRETLAMADWVSLKVDAVDDSLWRGVNRPHGLLDHQAILDGMLTFANTFSGTLATESMLLEGLNDTDRAASQLAEFLVSLNPDIAYLSVPIRPPAEAGVHAPSEKTLNRFYQIVKASVGQVELLTGYEGNAFVSTGDAAQDLLAITSVHPMREQAVRALLDDAGADWGLVEDLVEQGLLVKSDYQESTFYICRLPHSSG
jgi:wyosine [tRNA(Phe)-imidazoG37] synthetase (radical SAM superfamily)